MRSMLAARNNTMQLGGLARTGLGPLSSWSRHIFSYRRVLFWDFFRHNFAENGPQEVKIVQKDASRDSTQSVMKICS